MKEIQYQLMWLSMLNNLAANKAESMRLRRLIASESGKANGEGAIDWRSGEKAGMQP